MAQVTVFGAGAMGTAVAMHAARMGLDTALWANPFDGAALESIREKGRHPGLPEHIPPSLAVFGPDEEPAQPTEPPKGTPAPAFEPRRGLPPFPKPGPEPA